MLEVRSISRRYGDLKAVDDVSFSIQTGEIVGLLGHNGAGKTTIMKMLSGYLEPDSGSILFQGQQVAPGAKSLQRSLGYLPENLPVYPELSVASYLQYAAELKGIKGKYQRQALRDVTDATDLRDRFLSPISTLSRGMKQRVGVAQALLGNPSLLILDEPTNGLDPSQTEQMRQLIKSIGQSATVLISTHIMQEVEAMCDRALIVRQGQLAVDTTLSELDNTQRIALQTTVTQQVLSDAISTESWCESIVQNSTGDTVNSFVINVQGEIPASSVVEQCAIALVNRSIPILSIHADRQELQSLFMDVTSATDLAATEEQTHAL